MLGFAVFLDFVMAFPGRFPNNTQNVREETRHDTSKEKSTSLPIIFGLLAVFFWVFTCEIIVFYAALLGFYLVARRSGKLRPITSVVIGLAFIGGGAWFLGWFQAHVAVDSPSQAVIQLKDGDQKTAIGTLQLQTGIASAQSLNVAVIDTYGAGILAMDGPVFRLIRWDDIKEVKYARPKKEIPLICALDRNDKKLQQTKYCTPNY